MLLYLDLRNASNLLLILNKYKDNQDIKCLYNQITEGIERDYGKRVV